MLRGRARALCRAFHVWIGLGLGTLFVVLGLTGSLIAWLPELDQALNPTLLRSDWGTGLAPGAGTEVADGQITPGRVEDAIERLSSHPAYGQPRQIFLPLREGGVLIAWYTTRKPADALFTLPRSRQVMVDPVTLRIKGERDWGSVGFSRNSLTSTLYHLHHYLLAGQAGNAILGIAALLLLLLAACGVALSWPQTSWENLKRSLKVSYRGSWPRLQFSLHRSLGLVVAPFLIVLAFSGLYFTFPNLIVPLVGSVLPIDPRQVRSEEPFSAVSLIGPSQAIQVAQALYPSAKVTRLVLPAERNQPYEVRLRQPNERQDSGATRITIDAFSSKVLGIKDPKRAKAGDTFLGWLFPLHSGQAFGSGGKAAISVLGCMPLVLGVTGLFVWRRRGRKKNKSGLLKTGASSYD